ncbi:MAG: cysteine sulfinate desulfinase [Candidatus Omnitrophica bacterium CG1_02_46_14]|nr:MAG: cysteine sulfinate desulfinase [Candidatus Omnitrophica bacterium CG1_02_46_14]
MLATNSFNVQQIRKDFPMLKSLMNGYPLVYLDNAATTQKPISVIERLSEFYKKEYATIHRGVYTFSQMSTEECDLAREKCRTFLNAKETAEIIFVRGATEAINLVATGYGRKLLKPGDEILISAMEHHSNIVPWQMLCEEKGLKLKVAPMNDKGELELDEFQKLLGPRTYFVAVTHISNALGTINPIKEIIKCAHHAGAVVLIDGAQAAPHLKVDVQDLDCDFYCFSGHKIYGPTGVGVLYGKRRFLEKMDPYQFGGDMIESVTFEKTTFAKLPNKFEAGTPSITEIVGLGAAIDYIYSIGFEAIERQENELLRTAADRLSKIPSLKIIGTAREKAGLISFVLEGVHAHDIGTVLDQYGIAVRAGHHCAQPVMQRFHVPATARASFAFYNTIEEVDKLAEGIEKVLKIFQSAPCQWK